MRSADILASNPRFQAAQRLGRTGAVSTEQARFDKKHRGLSRVIGGRVAFILACALLGASLGSVLSDAWHAAAWLIGGGL